MDSSLWTEDDTTIKVFLTMLALKDRDHVVRNNAFGIATRAHKTEAEVLRSLEILSAPDTRRIEPQEHEGRRIEKVEDGWLILNGEKYRDMINICYRREYQRIKQSEYRQRLRDQQETDSSQSKTPALANEPNNHWSPTPLQLRLGKLFKRKETTRWDAKEEKAVKSLVSPLEDDLRLLEAYYGASIPKDQDYRRHDLVTLLNNFNGEVDRARKFKQTEPSQNQI